MAKIKYDRKGAFSNAVTEENEKLQNANKEIDEKIQHNDIAEINIDEIINPNKHDRVGYSRSAINEFAVSLKKVGQLQPIVVRRLENGKLERIIGFRRIMAAKQLKWKTIKAVVLSDISDEIAALMMLSENLHREDPNIYDQTVKIIEYVALSMDKTEDELKKLLFRLRNYDSGQLKELEEYEKDEREKIEFALEKTVKITITTLVDRLRVFNLEPVLIEAMREQGLSYINALELNKIRSEKYFTLLLNKAIDSGPSKNELKAWINEFKLQSNDIQGFKTEETLINKVSKQIKIKNLEKLEKDDYKKVMELLGSIDKILSK